MGLGPRITSCSVDSHSFVPTSSSIFSKNGRKLPNPDPKNFEVVNHKAFSGTIAPNLVVKIHYPDCTNYEGEKILLYTDLTWLEFCALKEVDPHFCEDHVSPFARFEPTNEGWEMACHIAEFVL